ncbi:hypothetical protein CDL15_Pgr026421 [Punica granatum]|uniref:Uncharacterized protein n=1 Tax=Punica granatum TaxID=22663 RepID=A0A218XPC4_PUNGR|nr:hypothetical protein CDL15_Pgr026421 [Punica granatum]PKI79031.1 hypothetical protein CRG98_000574 [Punica granatum]
MTFGWVFCASMLRAATTVIASLLGLNQDVLLWASLAITTALVFVLVTVFEVIDGALGAASGRERKSRRKREGMWGTF